MKTLPLRLATVAACALWCSAAVVKADAQESSESSLDVTIRLLPENAVGPQDITRRIELPPAVLDGLPRNEAAEGRGRGDEGLETAAEARERGREFGQETAEQARENRENTGRPDVPGRPDDAGPPDDVGAPDDVGPPGDVGRPDDAGPPEGLPARP